MLTVITKSHCWQWSWPVSGQWSVVEARPHLLLVKWTVVWFHLLLLSVDNFIHQNIIF